MAIEVNPCSAVCSKCGKSYGRRKGYFPVSYAVQHKGIGYIPVCKECIDTMYNSYLAQCGSAKDAVRQMCRKLDLFWSESVFAVVERKSTTHSMMTSYIAKINTVTYAGKSYDDTLSAEGTLWNWAGKNDQAETSEVAQKEEEDTAPIEYDISNDVIEFWGPGIPPEMYGELEQRRSYWMSRLPDDEKNDIGTEALIRQLCHLEITINHDRAAEKPIDKNVNMFNTLLGSLKLKPSQNKEDNLASLEGTPFGVWIKKWEDQRPITEPDPEMQDADGVIRYVLTWVFGHLCKMLNIKNAYTKLYESAIAKLRIEKPEYEDDDDETMINEVFASDDSEDEA